MNIRELKEKMIDTQSKVDAMLSELQNEDIEIVDVFVDKIDVTNRESGVKYIFRTRIETKIKS